MLTVEAQEQFTQVHASIEVSPSHGLTEDEIEDMLDAAIEHAADDVEQRLLIEAQVEAEQVLKALGDSLAMDRDMATEQELVQMTQVKEQLEEAIAQKQRKRIGDLTHKLMRCQPLCPVANRKGFGDRSWVDKMWITLLQNWACKVKTPDSGEWSV